MQNMLYNISRVTSSSPQTNRNAGNKKNGIMLSHIRLCYPSMPSLPLTLHAMLLYSVLFLSSSCSNSNNHKRTTKNRILCRNTYIILLLFPLISNERHKTLLWIRRQSTAHEDWTFQKLYIERIKWDSQPGSRLQASNCRILHSAAKTVSEIPH
jgi:hypothetical protein